VEATLPPRWAQIAHEHGYCDQSHLIRDFVAISGFSPMQLRARRSARVKASHVALSASASDSSNLGV
jgi:AraC-like DNA-binding protein